MINKAAAKYTNLILPILYFVFVLVSDYAIGNANAIKAGDINEYTVSFFLNYPLKTLSHLWH